MILILKIRKTRKDERCVLVKFDSKKKIGGSTMAGKIRKEVVRYIN